MWSLQGPRALRRPQQASGTALGSSVAATIDLASIDTDNKQRDNHLRSADYYEAEKYPTMSYRSTAIRRTDDGWLIDGELTLHGVTRHVPLAVEMNGFGPDPHGGQRAAFSATAQINRRDFGILVLPAGRAWRAHQHDPAAQLAVGEREYRYPMRQRAATLWFHDHRMDFTGPAVYRGLAGFWLVRDDVEDALPLPRGDRELPLMVADRAFAADGSFDYPSLDRTLREVPGVTEQYVAGVLGDVILVNGAPWPVHEVDAGRYRLRLLNASNARRYELTLDPPPPAGPAFVQIGSDGGLLAAPQPQASVVLAPAERYDVVVDFAGYPVGTEVTVHNPLGTGPTSVVMRFRVARRAPDDTAIPARLAEIEPLERGQAVRTRDFSLLSGRVAGRHGWVIGGRPFDPAHPVASPRLGDVEIWRFLTDLHHPLHLHLVTMRVLSRAGRPPGPLDEGLKDTVDLAPGEAVEVITRFEGYRGRYVFHCHNLEHEDMGMMATFETV